MKMFVLQFLVIYLQKKVLTSCTTQNGTEEFVLPRSLDTHLPLAFFFEVLLRALLVQMAIFN